MNAPIARGGTALDFLAGGGGMGARMREHDWAGSPLGPIGAWPQSLRTAVNLMLNSLHPMFLAWGPQLVFLYNDAYAPILGAKHPAALGGRFEDVWSDIWDGVSPLAERALAGEATWSEDLHLVMDRHGYAEDTWYTFSYSPVRDEGGDVGGMFCACTETTRKVLNEQRLTFQLQLSERLRDLTDPVEVTVAAAESLGRRLGASRVGYGDVDEDEILRIPRDWAAEGEWEGAPGTSRPLAAFGPAALAALRAGRVIQVDDAASDPAFAANLAAFEAIHARALLVAPLVKQGRLTAIFYVHQSAPRRWSAEDRALAEDVAERTWAAVERARVEAALRESEDHYRHAVELNPQVAWTSLPDGQLDRVAERWTEWTGVGGLGSAWSAALHPDDLAPTGRAWSRSVATGEPYDIEHRVRLRSGEYAWMRSRAFPRRGKDGRIVKWYGATENIHERKAAEARLRDSEAQFRTFAQAMPNHVWTAPADGRLDWFNDRVYHYAGAAHGSLDGDGWGAMLHPDDLPPTLAAWNRSLATGKTYEVEFRLRRADGAYRWHLGRALPIRGPDGAVLRWVGTNTDIEDQKAAAEALSRLNATLESRVEERSRELRTAEEALRQAQKMEAVGQLTGGIAHDFNNLLTGIIGSLDILRRRLASGRFVDIDRFIDAAVASANRAAGLTHRLLAFSRRQSLDSKPVEINRLAAAMEDLLRRSLGESITLFLNLEPDLWVAEADANQVESALLNLAINARDAMPGGGGLTVRTANARFEAGPAAQQEGLEPGDYVVMSVSDTGTGMTQDVLDRVFDPFFTTKPIGQGTGLGLSMIYGFAKQSGGQVRIVSAPGEGATVTLYLPRFRGEQPTEDSPAESPAPRARAGETVLVVEDDAAVRMLVVDVLQELGYDFLEAADAKAAAPILESPRQRIDLLISDVGLPGMNGRQLAEIARQARPGLKVLFITGYAENAAVRGGFLEPGMEMVAKPFALDDLAARIRQMLQADG